MSWHGKAADASVTEEERAALIECEGRRAPQLGDHLNEFKRVQAALSADQYVQELHELEERAPVVDAKYPRQTVLLDPAMAKDLGEE